MVRGKCSMTGDTVRRTKGHAARGPRRVLLFRANEFPVRKSNWYRALFSISAASSRVRLKIARG